MPEMMYPEGHDAHKPVDREHAVHREPRLHAVHDVDEPPALQVFSEQALHPVPEMYMPAGHLMQSPLKDEHC